MKRSSLATLVVLTVGALVLGAPPAASLADEEPPAKGADPSGQAEAPKTIEWVMGWAAGQERAQADGRLIFLYFGRKKPG